MRLSHSTSIKHDAILRVHSIYRQAREHGYAQNWILTSLNTVISDLRKLKVPQWVIESVHVVSQALLYEAQQRDLEACYVLPGGIVYSTLKESKLYATLSPAAFDAIRKHDLSCHYYWSHIPRRFS